MEIRRATKKDIPAIAPLWQTMMDFHNALDPRFRPAANGANYWAEALDGWLEDEKCCVLVADSGQQLGGYIIGWLHQPPPVFEPDIYGFVSDICVAADFRKMGVGRNLFNALKDWLVEHKASHVELRVTVANPTSQAFWREMGCTDYMDHMWCPLQASDSPARP